MLQTTGKTLTFLVVNFCLQSFVNVGSPLVVRFCAHLQRVHHWVELLQGVAVPASSTEFKLVSKNWGEQEGTEEGHEHGLVHTTQK